MIESGTLLLGKYRVAERLGEGGMGTVFRARDELLERDVAIKVLRADLAGRPGLLDRFRSEAMALARLAHPGIAALHGLERDGDQFYMVMEYVRGETVEQRLRRDGSLSWQDAIGICAAVCDALGHAHHLGVVHRDIKPANIMLAESGAHAVKVMDFGIARMTDQSRQTRHGNSVGTPHYMSPEQLRGEEVDGRADLYALGAVLFEMISSRVPFDADSDYELMMKQLNEPVPVLAGTIPGVPRAIDRLIARAMAKDRSVRFNSAAEMRSALTSTLSSSDFVPEHGTPTAAQPMHRDWRTWAAAAMVVIALGLTLTGGGDEPSKTSPLTESGAGQHSLVSPATDIATQAASSEFVRGYQPNPVIETTPPPPPPSRERPTPPPRRSEETKPKPAPAPPPPPPAPSRPAPTTVITREINGWLTGLSRRDPGGISGSIGKEQAAALVREGRASFESGSTPVIRIEGETASALISTIATVRSAFGSPRKQPVTLRLSFSGDDAGNWRITSARVESN